MARLNPYLNFPGTCREAMNFYKECIGGELVLQTVGEMPEMASQMPPEMKDSILHACLSSGKLVLMASDLNMNQPVEGNTVQLCLDCESEDELNHLFKTLSTGGKVVEQLADMPWGGRYGSITDRYGKHWLFNFQKSNS